MNYSFFLHFTFGHTVCRVLPLALLSLPCEGSEFVAVLKKVLFTECQAIHQKKQLPMSRDFIKIRLEQKANEISCA